MLFTPKHCLSYLRFKVHVYVWVCIYQSICLNQIFLLSSRVLWFSWSQPVPQHRGEHWTVTAELWLSWRCSFSSFGSAYFDHKAKCFRKIHRNTMPQSMLFTWSAKQSVLPISSLFPVCLSTQCRDKLACRSHLFVWTPVTTQMHQWLLEGATFEYSSCSFHLIF